MQAPSLETLATRSAHMNAVEIQMVFKGRWVTCEIDVMELQHVAPIELWHRHLVPALRELEAPITQQDVALTATQA